MKCISKNSVKIHATGFYSTDCIRWKCISKCQLIRRTIVEKWCCFHRFQIINESRGGRLWYGLWVRTDHQGRKRFEIAFFWQHQPKVISLHSKIRHRPQQKSIIPHITLVAFVAMLITDWYSANIYIYFSCIWIENATLMPQYPRCGGEMPHDATRLPQREISISYWYSAMPHDATWCHTPFSGFRVFFLKAERKGQPSSDGCPFALAQNDRTSLAPHSMISQ